MAHRPHFYVRRLVPVEPPPSPASYQAKVTVEIRVFYPPNHRQRAERVLADAVSEAFGRFRDE